MRVSEPVPTVFLDLFDDAPPAADEDSVEAPFRVDPGLLRVSGPLPVASLALCRFVWCDGETKPVRLR